MWPQPIGLLASGGFPLDPVVAPAGAADSASVTGGQWTAAAVAADPAQHGRPADDRPRHLWHESCCQPHAGPDQRN